MGLREELARGPYPEEDGWGCLYRFFARVAPPGGHFRRLVCGYFWPKSFERWRRGLLYRSIGVHIFGALLPTGGSSIRRWTGARMRPYTLSRTSVDAARQFFYKTCVFEMLHMPFLVALIGLAVHRASIGRFDLAMQNTLVNLVANVYPTMHHRRTRTRIVEIVARRQRDSILPERLQRIDARDLQGGD